MSNHWHKTPISLLLPGILAKFPENSIDFQVLPEGYANPNTNVRATERYDWIMKYITFK